jgi:hypothetical protein
MLNFDSPKIRLSLAQAALHEPYPSWLMDPYGFVRSANLMALWLWSGLKETEAIQPELLMGKNIFDIQAANFARIPLSRNIEFYTKQAVLVKRAAANWKSSPFESFITAMQDDLYLAQIYEDAVPSHERVWEYRLIITSPDSDEALSLNVTTYRLEGEAGFLALTSPVANTLPTVEMQYSKIMTRYGGEAYVISTPPGKEPASPSLLSNLPDYYRVYYPTLVQDPLWYNIEENKALQLTFGGSVIGMHFFELFFAPQLRPWLGPIQETSAPRAMRYFEIFTAPLHHEDHELHAAFLQVLRRISLLPEYNKLLELSWKSSIYLNLPINEEDPFYTCRVLLPWLLAPEVTLQFRSMVRYMHKGLLINDELQYYQLTLVPENYETEVALLLSYLSSDLEDSERGTFKQLLWGLTLLKTVEEGLFKLDGEDASWVPEVAFERIYQDIEREIHAEEELTTALQQSLTNLKKIMDADTLLSLLKILATCKSLDSFGAFLAQEPGRTQQEKEIGQLTL